jgi:hypothetical protein
VSKDDKVLCVAVGGFVAIVVVVIACCGWQHSKGYPRATVITPNATYENVQVNYHTSKYGTTYDIYTDDGNVMTITGSSTIVWNAKENNK